MDDNMTKEFEKQYEEHREFYVKTAKTVKNLLVNLLNKNHQKSIINFRVKKKNSCIEKINRKYKDRIEKENIAPFGLLTDIIGIRIICMYESEIEKIAKLIEEEFEILEKTDKTKIIMENDNTFGYKGLHIDAKFSSTRIELPEYNAYDGIQFEIQIRTIIQNAWSELDHQIKYKKHIPQELKRRINRLAALFEIADSEFETIYNISIQLQEEAKEEIKESTKEEVEEEKNLDIFSFVAILESAYNESVYQSWAVESLLDDILNADSNFDSKSLKNALSEENIKRVNEYFSSKKIFPSPSFFTITRHVLYLYDKKKFNDILLYKDEFNDWLIHNKS